MKLTGPVGRQGVRPPPPTPPRAVLLELRLYALRSALLAVLAVLTLGVVSCGLGLFSGGDVEKSSDGAAVANIALCGGGTVGPAGEEGGGGSSGGGGGGAVARTVLAVAAATVVAVAGTAATTR